MGSAAKGVAGCASDPGRTSCYARRGNRISQGTLRTRTVGGDRKPWSTCIRTRLRIRRIELLFELICICPGPMLGHPEVKSLVKKMPAGAASIGRKFHQFQNDIDE